MTTLTLTGRATPDQTQTYAHLPFEVPLGTIRIDVKYAYSDEVGSDPRLTDGNTVDIGIFDARGIDFLTDGFRGWSGSARREFSIGLTEATPGYVAGPIQPGTWHIALGLYKIAPQGCEITVEIALTAGESGETADFPARLPMRETVSAHTRPDGWYCGELHCHSYHSDGDSDPAAVVRKAEILGLDFLAVTDHNVLTQQVTLNSVETSLVLIPGCEVTTYKGHWNIWGEDGWIDFRVTEEAHLRRAADEATRRGYHRSLNHPRQFGPEWAYPAVDDFDSFEVWNGPWPALNDQCVEFWEERLRAGRRIPAVGGSDCHFHKHEHPAKLAEPIVWAYAPQGLTARAVLEAVRAGHVMISESINGPRLFMRVGDAIMGDAVPRPEDGRLLRLTLHVERGAGCILEVVTARGIVATLDVTTNDVRFNLGVDVSDSPYVRAQIADQRHPARMIRALTNPIYLD